MERKVLVGAIFIALVAIIIGFYTPTSTGVETVKIGHIGPLTGFMATYGEQERQGIDLAVKEINDNDFIKGVKLEVIHEDDQMDPTMATNAINKLITVDKVPAVIGEMTSSVTLALAPIAERNKVVLITPQATSNKISSAGDYIFRTFASNALEAKYLIELASLLNSTNGAILYMNNDFGIDLEQSIDEGFTKNVGTIVISEGYNPDATDFRTQLIKIQAKNPSVIFLIGYPNDMAMVLKQAKELGIKSQFIAPDTFNEPKIIDLGGSATEGVIFLYPKGGDPKLYQEFNQKIKNKYGDNATIVTSMAYDTMNVLATAMKSNGITAESIKIGLYQIKDYPGVTGNFTFDKNGDVISRSYIFKVVKGGMFVDYVK